MDVVPVDAIHYAQGFQRDVVSLDGIFYVRNTHAHCLQLLIVGDAVYLRTYCAADIHHRCLWQLLDAFHHDVSCELGELGECHPVLSPLPLGGGREGAVYIKEEGRNIHCTCLHHLGTLHLLWHLVHGTVHLLVHLYEKQVYVAARLKGHPDTAGIHSRLGTDIGNTCHLHQTASERRHDIPLHFLGRIPGHTYLHGYLRDVNVRHQGHGDVPERQYAYYRQGDDAHGDGYGTMEKCLVHAVYCWSFTITSVPSARFRLPEVMTISPSLIVVSLR